MLLQMQIWALMLLQESGAPGWDFRHLWMQMGGLAKGVVVIMFLAKVVVAGLQEFNAHQGSAEISGEEIEASKRALERAEAIVHAELKRGVSALATIGSTAPFVGLFGTVVGIINAFKTMAAEKTPGIGAIAGGISEALVTTAIGLFVAVPAVWMFNYFTGRCDAFDVEMGNSSSELVDYFLKRAQARSASRK